MKLKQLTGVVVGAMMIFAAPNAWAFSVRLMDLIITPKNAEVCGHDYSRAWALIIVKELYNGKTKVVVKVRNAKPNHIYTMWLKLDGKSPVTGAGATPAAGAVALQNILDNADSESASGDNAFYTNSQGNGHLEVWLDFHLSDGVYPFSMHDESLADVEIGHSSFTFRIISHCTDNVQHGGYPGKPHEPTFQISLD